MRVRYLMLGPSQPWIRHQLYRSISTLVTCTPYFPFTYASSAPLFFVDKNILWPVYNIFIFFFSFEGGGWPFLTSPPLNSESKSQTLHWLSVRIRRTQFFRPRTTKPYASTLLRRSVISSVCNIFHSGHTQTWDNTKPDSPHRSRIIIQCILYNTLDIVLQW